MGISVQINDNKSAELTFPRLMISKGPHPKQIVLFKSQRVGTVISTNDEYVAKVGTWNKDWDMSSFVDFKGSIILTNS